MTVVALPSFRLRPLLTLTITVCKSKRSARTRRVVVTCLGKAQFIGVNADEVVAALKAGKSGIAADAATIKHGFRSQVAGAIDIDIAALVDKRSLRFKRPARPRPISPCARPVVRKTGEPPAGRVRCAALLRGNGRGV